MSDLYDLYDDSKEDLIESHGAGKVLYLLNLTNTNKRVQIIAHSTAENIIELPGNNIVSAANNPEVMIGIESGVTEMEICLAPKQPSLESPITLLPLTQAFLTSLGITPSTAKLQAKQVNVGTPTMVNDRKRVLGDAAFEYQLDDLLLEQTFLLRFEPQLINETATLLLSVNDADPENIVDIRPKLIQHNNYYFMLVNIDNKDARRVEINLTIDYDGYRRKYKATDHTVLLRSSVDDPPNIPLFSMSSMVAKIQIQEGNTYYYDGFRYIQFMIPVFDNSVVVLNTNIGLQNFNIRALHTETTSNPIIDRAELAELMYLEPDDPIINAQPANRVTVYGYREAGSALFQAKVPVGVYGDIWFGINPMAGNGNLLNFNEQQQHVQGINVRLPSYHNSSSEVYVANYGTFTESTLMPALYIMDEYLVPGKAMAFESGTGLDILYVDENVQYGEVYSASGLGHRNLDKVGRVKPLHIGPRVLATFNNINSKIDLVNFSNNDKLGVSLESKTFVIFRDIDNTLRLLVYVTVGGVAVDLFKSIVLMTPAEMDTHGFTADKPMKYVYRNSATTPASTYEVTKPYDVTYAELTTFEPTQMVNMNSSVIITDLFGFNK